MIPRKRPPAATVPDIEMETLSLPPVEPRNAKKGPATAAGRPSEEEPTTAVRDGADIEAMLRDTLGSYMAEDRSLASMSIATLKRPGPQESTVVPKSAAASPPSSSSAVSPESSSTPRSDPLLGSVMKEPLASRNEQPAAASVVSLPRGVPTLEGIPDEPRRQAKSEVWIFQDGARGAAPSEVASDDAPAPPQPANRAELEERFGSTVRLEYATPPTTFSPNAVLAAIPNATNPSSAQFRATQAAASVGSPAAQPPVPHSQPPHPAAISPPNLQPYPPSANLGYAATLPRIPSSNIPLAAYPAPSPSQASPATRTAITRKKRRPILPWVITAAAVGSCVWILVDGGSRDKIAAGVRGFTDRAPAGTVATQAQTGAATEAPAQAPVVLAAVSWQPASGNDKWATDATAASTAATSSTATSTTTTTSTATATTTSTATATTTSTTTSTTSTTNANAKAGQHPRTPTPRPRPVRAPKQSGAAAPAADPEDDAAAAAAKAVNKELEDTLDR